jgi:hypothetical protein
MTRDHGMSTSVPRLTLVVRDGQRLRPCEVREYTEPAGRTGPLPPWQEWPVCGQTPTRLDPDGFALCADHFDRLATCGDCGAEGEQAEALRWHPTADCMLCAACWWEDTATTDETEKATP